MMKIRYIPFHSDEWLTGCAGLDNAERGMYITACALIYSHGGPIPEVELRRACRDHGHAYKRQLDCLISMGKLLLHDGQIDNKRCANELQTLRKRSANGRQNVSKRWKNNAVANDLAIQRANANQEPITSITASSSREDAVILGSREASPSPLPSHGDGAVAARAKGERLPSSDDLIDPAEKAAALAELHRALGIVSERTAVLNGHAEPAP